MCTLHTQSAIHNNKNTLHPKKNQNKTETKNKTQVSNKPKQSNQYTRPWARIELFQHRIFYNKILIHNESEQRLNIFDRFIRFDSVFFSLVFFFAMFVYRFQIAGNFCFLVFCLIRLYHTHILDSMRSKKQRLLLVLFWTKYFCLKFDFFAAMLALCEIVIISSFGHVQVHTNLKCQT